VLTEFVGLAVPVGLAISVGLAEPVEVSVGLAGPVKVSVGLAESDALPETVGSGDAFDGGELVTST